jgi:histidine phosphotransferase ChpT
MAHEGADFEDMAHGRAGPGAADRGDWTMDVNDPLDLAGLMCSRLCHDLISPVGAIGNGVELLAAVVTPGPDEIGLIEQSAQAAAAALAFFRVAYGAVAPGAAPLGLRDIGALARAHLGGGRLVIDWPSDPEERIGREEGRALLLMTLAAAGAAPAGGALSASPPQERPLRLSVAVTGRRCAFQPAALAALTGAPWPEPLGPREAHLALLARVAARLGAALSVEAAEDRATLTLSAA